MPQQNRNVQNRFSHGLFQFRQNDLKEFLDKAADALDEKLSQRMEGSALEAPILTDDPEPFHWYRIPLEKGLAADGSAYHIYMRKGTTDRLCLFFSGGGLAWNEYTAAHPITGGGLVSGKPNYYYNNLRPVTQLMNIGSGIMENSERNPFYNWNFIVITYATGDFHIGRNDYPYTDTDGSAQVLHFHGYTNFQEAMQKATNFFPSPDHLLIAGDSAGGFAVPALAEEIADIWYPNCTKITLLTDASLLCYDKWIHTIQDLWKADSSKYDTITSNNLTFEWYKKLISNNRGRFRCLYCGSTHDYLLSTYYNDVTKSTFEKNAEVQDAFYQQLSKMVYDLLELDPSFTFMIHNLKNPLTHGGTIHTAVRRMWFYTPTNGTTIAKWLEQAINGTAINIGLNLLIHE